MTRKTWLLRPGAPGLREPRHPSVWHLAFMAFCIWHSWHFAFGIHGILHLAFMALGIEHLAFGIEH
jgi:hypothetical protein